MLKEGISRRQFIGGAAAVAAASAMPVLTSAAPALADDGTIVVSQLALNTTNFPVWTDLDATKAARLAWGVYWGKGGTGTGSG